MISCMARELMLSDNQLLAACLTSIIAVQVAVGALLGVVTGYLLGITWHGLGMPS